MTDLLSVPPWAKTASGYEPTGPVRDSHVGWCYRCDLPTTLGDAVDGRSTLITLDLTDPATRRPHVVRLCPKCTQEADRG
ncbi:MAG TPA: hypothetical protein VIR27_05060 [Mycobacteriales bacterium]